MSDPPRSRESEPPRPDLFAAAAERVSVYEVSPRDGLQNEATVVSVDDKLALIDALVAAGLTRIEGTSFVSPKWIPQLADADALCARLRVPDGVTVSALCPNSRGLERAVAARLPEVAVFMSASETHSQVNINKSIAGALTTFEELIPSARAAGLAVRAYVSTVWGCPYEGAVDPAVSVRIAARLHELGAYEVSLGDTIGVGTPRQTHALLERLRDALPLSALALHMHDTRGTALANVLVGLQHGIRTFDAAVGGVGGCPYAPGASGNLATEDLVYLLHGMGIETGVDLERLIEAGRLASRILGRPLPGKVQAAGVFQRRSLRR